jgi:hypothetical protein
MINLRFNAQAGLYILTSPELWLCTKAEEDNSAGNTQGKTEIKSPVPTFKVATWTEDFAAPAA